MFRKKQFGFKGKKLLILLVGWGETLKRYWVATVILRWAGFDVLVYEYDYAVLSPDIHKTKRELTNISKDVLESVHFFKNQGYYEIDMFGTSLGTTVVMMVVKKSKDINKIILNLIGADMATAVWSWDIINTKFKAELLRQKITLVKLKKVWRELAPICELENVTCDKILIYLAKNDEVIPFRDSKKLLNKLDNLQINYQVVINDQGGHLFNGAVNTLKFRRWVKFLG